MHDYPFRVRAHSGPAQQWALGPSLGNAATCSYPTGWGWSPAFVYGSINGVRSVGNPDRRRGSSMTQTAEHEVGAGRSFSVHLFGHTAVRTPARTLRASDFAGVKPRQILELIALGRGEPVRKAVIAEHIWSGRPPRRWQVTLESYVALL